MSQLDPRSVVRLAIALTALKLKPRQQSVASYLLDLQSRFPSATNDHDNRDWRMYALELEKQLAAFKAQRHADQELFSKLFSDTSQVAPTSDAPPPKKKSKKNTKDQHDPESCWDQSRADLSRFLSSQYPPSPSLVAVCASLRGILAIPDADLISHTSHLTDAILRVLDTIGAFLFTSPRLGPDLCTRAVPGTASESQHVDSPRIAMISPLLTYVLRTAIPALLRGIHGVNKRQRQRIATDPHVHVDKVLDHLLECVLLPLLRALVPLSFERFAPLTTPPPKTPGRPARKGKNKDKRAGACPRKGSDTRTDALTLISISLDALDALPSPPGGVAGSVIAGGIRDRLGLEAIRELEALCVLPSELPKVTRARAPRSSAPRSQLECQGRAQQNSVSESCVRQLERLAGTRAERVRALAMRDAGWLLASTLSLCVAPVPVLPGGPMCESVDGRAGHPGRQLREALLNRVGKLIQSVHVGNSNGIEAASRLAVGPVCQNMLLAICERAVTQLTSS